MRCWSDTNWSTSSSIIALIVVSPASDHLQHLSSTTYTPQDYHHYNPRTMSGTVRPPASAREQTLLQTLSAYMAHISARNKRSLTVYISLISAMRPPPGGSFYAINVGEVYRVLRLRSLWRLLAIPTNPAFPTLGSQDNLIARYVPTAVTSTDAQLILFRETVDDILRYYDFLAGLAPLGVDGEWVRLYFSALEKTLKENCVVEVRERISAPEELKLLAEWLLVDGLDGRGLPFYKAHNHGGGYRVWYGLAQCVPESQVSNLDQEANYGVIMGQLVKDARNGDLARFAQVDEEKWTVGGGFEMGGGDGARIYAVYAKSDTLWWGWRYFVVVKDNEGQSRKWEFRNVPELLGWAKSYREEKFLAGEAAIRASVSDRNVWEGKWEGDEEEDDDA
ncbi:hypothetical protein QBC37DRAFT_373223 [Rhypophila decipiens]|uniref:Uncharacterized protein n=1 Tax=Rhypophila decipiens TaxID=261697 RepID=A0AAN7B7Y4_9PEZI|nr:hypothetical protein QBC37DRAFT_373223 [Rhypophila decipiens]